MKIRQIIVNKNIVNIFTDDIEGDLRTFQSKYEAGDSKVSLGYDDPCLSVYRFLGKDYPCISLWFDNEDIPDFYTDFHSKAD